MTVRSVVGRRTPRRRRAIASVVAGACAATVALAIATTSPAVATVPAGWVLRVEVPEAIGAKTVLGQLTVDNATEPGYVTAYGCDDGIPHDSNGGIARSDVNFDGRVTPVASNRLIVQADSDGDICFYTSHAVDLIVDVNAVSFDVGMNSFANVRTDTRIGTPTPQIAAGGTLKVRVPAAAGGRTAIGQLTVDHAADAGYVTAYPCSHGVPRNDDAVVSRSDLNFDGRVTPVASNRLVVEADEAGDVCFHASAPVDMIVDINAAADSGIVSFPNRRTDTRRSSAPQIPVDGVVRVNVPRAAGGKTVIGQLTVDHARDAGFLTAYPCADGLPVDEHGGVSRSDLNYDGAVSSVASNRLIVQADHDGDVCVYTSSAVDVIVDVNAVSGIGISSFPNRRTDTRTGTTTAELPNTYAAPTWPPYEPRPALDSTAALTGETANSVVRRRPVVAVKIDNYRAARPQWGLEHADAVIEENVEGVTRFVALFHTTVPAHVGPVRSARTGDLDLLAAMNRPVFSYSGANAGVNAWIRAAADAGALVDFSSQRRPCYHRTPERPGPHDLIVDIPCALDVATTAGPAQPLWPIDPDWTAGAGVVSTADTTFTVPMDGVVVDWTWHASSRTYLRSQDGEPHVSASGTRISARNVVEVFSQHVPSPVDARSPNPITTGSGEGVVHRGGRAIPVIWYRATPYDAFTFHDRATGAAVPLDRGTTFVELVRDR